MLKQLIKLRKELHSMPEISGDESKTAKKIVEELKKCNPDELIEGVGGTGIIAKFSSKRSPKGKSILFRAELDAIAVNEETGLPYRSKNKGIMHGCGHDGHMAILTGLAYHLKENPPEENDVILLFQPAEENGEGAAQILKDERFQKLKVDHAFALHNLPGYAEGSVLIKPGVFAAASTGVEIILKGRSSHAAYPEQGMNPSLYIAEIIRVAEERLSGFKKENHLNKSVISYISLGEKAFGINPGIGRIGFTLRSPHDDQLGKAVKILKKISDSISDKFEGTVEMRLAEPFAATVNDREGVEIVKSSAKKLGVEVIDLIDPFPWSEDFGEFRRKFPIALFGLGAGESSPPLHSEKYDFNDKLITQGVDIFKQIIQDF
jgi:amidohydrolase